MSTSLLPLTSFPCKPSTNKPFNSKPSFNTRTNRTQNGFRVSCNVTPPNNDNDENKLILPEQPKLILPNNYNNVDRRNLLVGLGGLYTAANLSSLPGALAAPITGPDDIFFCRLAEKADKNGVPQLLTGDIRSKKCCAPVSNKKVKEFKFPDQNEAVRMRWPAHKGTAEQIKRYKDAMKVMRNLDPNHPHSFESQAKIHCAYCNGGYTQGESNLKIQIHNSWLFFPFHRWYLYFYERILGKLINEPTFALPYWNWDNPEGGMMIPEIFLGDDVNPLFDKYREAKNQPPTMVDLSYAPGGKNNLKRSDENQIRCNLRTVYKELISNAPDATDFFGGTYVVGNKVPKAAGSVEKGSHTALHVFVGDSNNKPYSEDMGNFYSAGYDPLFYVHHANVDRMWKLWKDLPIPGHVEHTNPDWLNASYVFYDEEGDLVRVSNRDSVDLNKLKFNYAQPSEFEISNLLKSRPTQRSKNVKVTSIADVKTLDQETFPVTLDKIFKVRVKRPKVNRTKEEKLKEKEVLVIKEIKYGGDKFVKFDVFVNDNVQGTGKIPDSCSAEFAGTYSQIPHGDMSEMTMTDDKEKNAARFVLTELFEDTKTEGQEEALVVFVPRAGCEDLDISGIEIKLETIKT